MKRTRPYHAAESFRKLFQKISLSYGTCQIFSAPLQQIRIGLPPSDVVFNQEVSKYLIWIDKKAQLHVEGLEPKLISATFLRNQILETVWDAFISCWASLYIVFPLKMRAYLGSAFTTVRWTRKANAVSTMVQTSGVELHNSIGSGERCHVPL